MPPVKRKSSSSPGVRPPATGAPIFPSPSSGNPRFVACPTCGKSFACAFVQNHAWQCCESTRSGDTSTSSGRQDEGDKRCALQRGGKKDPRKFVECPTCGRSFPLYVIEHHAWECQPHRQERHGAKRDLHTAAAAASFKKCRRGLKTLEQAANGMVRTTGAEHASGWRTESTGQLESRRIAGSPASAFSPEGRLVMPATSCSYQEAATSQQGAGFDKEEGGEQPRARSPNRKQKNAVQKIMEGGKRAVESEKKAKMVPRDWPVELVADILPKEKADSLLACLLEVSRDWTSQPWYNNNGVEGRSHSRSHIYRLSTSTNGGGDSSTIDHGPASNDEEASHARPTEAARMAASTPCIESPRAAAAAGDDGDCSRGVCSTDGRTGERCYCESQTNQKDVMATVGSSYSSSSEEESFDYFVGAATDDGKEPRDVVVSASGRGNGSGQVQAGKAGSGGAMSASAASSSKGDAVPTVSIKRRDRRATYEEMMLDENSDVAPAELLEVVPHVVEAVRRRQLQRVMEGLGGEEGLHWAPNFCICHVYDDHRSHIGPHSDTLSNIGPQAIVAGVSLGAKRVFVVQETLPWGTKPPSASDFSGGGKKRIDMPHNTVVVMWGGCQERYKHGVPALPKGVGTHPIAGTKRISITLRQRKEALPRYLLPIPDCRCGVPATLKARVLKNGGVEYFFQCDRGQGQCGFMQSKALARN